MDSGDGGMKVLITGGGGFIGSYLVRRLLSEGHSITILDRVPQASSVLPRLGISSHPMMRYVIGSVTDDCAWLSLDHNFDCVVHAAAILGIERVAREQIETMDTIISGTRSALEFAATQARLCRFLYLSTSEIYGVSAAGPCEGDQANIQTDGRRWCYAAAKLAGEFYTTSLANKYGFDFTIIRPFNVYGPFRSLTNAVTMIAARAVANDPIAITGSGAQTRAWCYVDDFIDGITRALTADAGRNQVFNLGNDRTEISMLDLAHLVCELSGSSSQISTGGTIEDVLRRFPNLGKAKRLLDYNPSTTLRDGLIKVITSLRTDV